MTIKQIIGISFLFFSLATLAQPEKLIQAEQIAPTPIGNQVVQEDWSIHSFTNVVVKPEFPGGMERLFAFFSENFKTTDPEIKGIIFLTFVIETNGTLSDIKVIRDLGDGTGEEAIRVMKMSPKWKPGQIEGKNIRTQYTVPLKVAGKK
jgi:protein TonB